MEINNLLYEFFKTIITFDFLWIVVAVIITMEMLKKWGVFPETMKSNKYPLWAFIVAVGWILLKTAFTGKWNEIVSNVLFTAFLADVIYTFLGKYIIDGIVYLFKKLTGNLPSDESK